MPLQSQTRITIALDDETSDLIEKMKADKRVSQSDLIRKAVRFYHENERLSEDSLRRKVDFYIDMLPSTEHVILDVDHWLLFLSLIESSPEKKRFWEKHREIARSHVDQLRGKVHSVEDILERLEACNFFIKAKNSEGDFTLVLYSETTKQFIKVFLEEFFSAMGLKVEIRENLSKLRVSAKP